MNVLKKSGLLKVNALKLLKKSGLLMVNALKLLKKKWFTDGKCTIVIKAAEREDIMVNYCENGK